MFASLIFVFTVSLLIHAENIASSPLYQEANYCLLPPYPEHGKYTVSNYSSATPGDRYSTVRLDISCDTGYLTNNNIKSILCLNGFWSASMPTCVHDLLGFCTLTTDDLKVEYRCLTPGSRKTSEECKSFVPSGAVVTPICRSPAYFSLKPLSEMHCNNGVWDYNPICKPACGLTTESRQHDGTSSTNLKLPWHVVIYHKISEHFEQLCGGSLITATKIISNALCYHTKSRQRRPPSDYMAAVNKMYSAYEDTRDKNSQYSAIIEINIPSSYRITQNGQEDNISVVVVKSPFFFHMSVRPLCLDFDNNLDGTQLTDGNYGKTVRWSKVGDNGLSSTMLNVVDYSYMKKEDCSKNWAMVFLRYPSKEKICTRYSYDSWQSKTDAGSGLAFLDPDTRRYFLRGVHYGFFVGPAGNILIVYTSVVNSEHFIKQYL